MLWRRLDAPGHDACRLDETDAGWGLQGTAVFRHDGLPVRLAYDIVCDPAWHTLHGQVEGWIGARPVALEITRTDAGGWALNGSAVSDVEHSVDLDLGFTPATNVIPLRRLALAVGQAAEAPAAWLDVFAGTLATLPQRYERRSNATYWYEAPTVGYAALLEVDATGFVVQFPRLWEAGS